MADTNGVLFNIPILVRGGGDLASGVIYRLTQAGFPVIVTELEKPLLVRPTVSYGAAVFYGEVRVEQLTARRVSLADWDGASDRSNSAIPVVIDPGGELLTRLHPPILIDARMAKINLGTTLADAPLVVALGPGFTAGVDCHAVIETNRGHMLGRVIRSGGAEPDTAAPGAVNGRSSERVLRAPRNGYVTRQAPIGELIRAGEAVAWMDDSDQAILAPFDGMLRGLIHESVFVTAGLKIGDLDPRGQREQCFTISDKSLAVGGGVVEAVLSAPQIRGLIRTLIADGGKDHPADRAAHPV